VATSKTHGSRASNGAERVLDRGVGKRVRHRVRPIAVFFAFFIVAGLALMPLLDSAQALAQATSTPTPTRTPTKVPPTATPFPCNTGSSAGMTYTYADLHRWNSEVLSVSNSTGVPANVIKAIMWVESRGMLNARSPLTSSGYYFGLMQVGSTSAVPDYMKSVTWMCDNAYNQVLAGGTEMVNKSIAIGSQNWIQVAGAYFGYGTDVTGTTTNSYMQQFHTHATALIGTTPGGADWTPPPLPTPTVAPVVTFAIGSTISVDSDTLNMRNNPGLSTTITRVLLDGTSGTVLAGPNRVDNYDWYQIRLGDGTVGWVAGQFMKSGTGAGGTATPRSGAATPTPGGAAGGGFSVGDGFRVTTYVNFRSSPGYAGGILDSLQIGTTGTIIGAGRTVDGLHWSNVRLSDNRTGWIATDYITRTTSSTATATATATRPAATPSRTPSPTATSASVDNAAGTVYRTVTRLNIRQSPGTASAIIATLPTNTLVTSLGTTSTADGHTWVRVQAGVIIGWVSNRYLAATGTTASTPTGVATVTRTPVSTKQATAPGATAGQVYRTTTRVNIRQAPSTSGAILATLPSGTTMVSLGDSASANGYTWARVQAGSLVGWLATNYISATGGTASTPTGVPSLTPEKVNTPTRPANGYISGDIIRVIDGPLNYRTSAGTSGTIIGTLSTGTTAMVLNGPTSASGMSWYELQVSGRPNGWVASDFIGLVSASVVHGSTGEEAVGMTVELTATPTITPTAAATVPDLADAPIGQTESTVQPSETPVSEATAQPTGETAQTDEPVATEAIAPTEEIAPAETALPTETLAPTDTPVIPTETPLPPTETPTPTATATLAPDSDGDGVEDALDACAGVADSGLDSDGDGLDDACDPTPFGEPTQPPMVERSFESYAAADASVSAVDPSAVQPGETAGALPIGGETGGIAYLTFYPDQIGYGQVQRATLYLTGMSGSGSVSVAVANGVVIDEYALTFDTSPSGSWAADAWVDAGAVVPIDLTGWIAADGPVTIIISGEGVSLGSREGGAPAYLSITVLDSP